MIRDTSTDVEDCTKKKGLGRLFKGPSMVEFPKEIFQCMGSIKRCNCVTLHCMNQKLNGGIFSFAQERTHEC